MLTYRLITGSLLIACLLGMIAVDEWVGRFDNIPPGLILFLFTILIVFPLAGRELVAVARAQQIEQSSLLVIADSAMLLATLFVSMHFGQPGITEHLPATALAVIFLLGLVIYSRGRRTAGVLTSTSVTLMLCIYLGLFLGFYLLIRAEHSAWWIVGIVLTVKACDTGAYFTGRAIGRYKLIPWLSPGKTWEGTAGGLVWSTLAGLGLAAASGWLPAPADHVPLVWGAVCGLIFGAVGQIGDLTMSLFKRGAGVKDSSTILPGMGGAMDVLDSLILVAPVAYWMLVVF